MTKQRKLDRAFDRIAVLKSIVHLERLRAERSPRDQRNIDLGLIEQDLPQAAAKEQIAEMFNEIQALLDHLHVTHLAATFETEALAKLGTIIGETKKAVRIDRKERSAWPVNLVKSQQDFEGLHAISAALSLPAEAQSSFAKIRKCRNEFCHQGWSNGAPSIDCDETKLLLVELLESII